MAGTEATRIPEQVQTALNSSPIHALRELQVEQDAETIILSGRVETYYHKQLAQEIVRTVLDGRQLVNSIHVDYIS
ncbi:MAG: BON domain-containing protein [Planctomycetaceae bacterium]|nr:BON domain-containing protein [Planctomycetaceae bacterium]